MIFNGRKRKDQNTERILLLDHIRYQIPLSEAQWVHTTTWTQDFHQALVDWKIGSIKKGDAVKMTAKYVDNLIVEKL